MFFLRLLKKFSFILVASMGLYLRAQVYPASNFTLVSRLDPETGVNSDGNKYSACWGWFQSSKNKEYAIACSQGGTYWVDVTNPATPSVSAYMAGAMSGGTWREVKTYQNYCYVISDDAGNNSFQIFDMQNLPASVTKLYDGQSYFKQAHTLWVDKDKLYVAAVTYSDNTKATMNVYSLANPASPVLLRSLNQDFPLITYVHDMFVRNDTVFASCAYQGLYVFKFNPVTNTFSQLGSLSTYPASGYNHSSALTPDGKTLVFTDEVPAGLPIKFAKVSNLSNIFVMATTNQYSQSTPHNPFIVNNSYCFMSSYMDGLQLYDISNPSNPLLAGYFDTFPQGGGNNNNWTPGNYQGQWGAYPYFPSRTIFALDQFNGIFMLRTHLYSNNMAGLKEQAPPPFNLLVFPNPGQGELTFNLPAGVDVTNLQISLADATGKEILLENVSRLPEQGLYYRKINLERLNQGFYYLKLQSGGKILSGKKIIISE